jgi:hypothetical protein
MSKNRLAVLISGSYRNFDEVWPLNKTILDNLDVEYEVFFQTWRRNPSLDFDVLDNIYKNKFYFSPFTREFLPFIESIEKQEIQTKYNLKSVQVQEFDEESISFEFNLGTPEGNQLYRSQLNSCGMYLGIDSVFQQLKLSDSFTHFLRLRPDFRLDADMLNEIFNNDLVFFGQLLPTEEGPIGDQCYGGPLSKSEFILDTMSQLRSMTANHAWNIPQPTVLAENVIRLHLAPHRNALKILFLSGCGEIVRPRQILAEAPISLEGLQKIFMHNFLVLKSKARRLRR